MKKIVILVLLLSSLACAQKQAADYTVKMHVARVHMERDKYQHLYLDVIVNGKKYELRGPSVNGVLALGDYRARLSTDEHKTSYESVQSYELLMPDGSVREFDVVGQTE